MSWRVVVISNRSKCDYKMGFLVVRQDDTEKRIHLGDISVLMFETTAVSLTAYLLVELTARKIKVVFCDNLHNPTAEVISMYGSYISSGKIREQIGWDDEIKCKVWREITKRKIQNQANVLRKVGEIEKYEQLSDYAEQVQDGDVTNREGHAAKVYFNALFDDDFYRGKGDVRNAVLDYGYSILLSTFNREIAASGYLTQVGIWHDNASNPFNLGSDLMETFRPIIDIFAYNCGFEKFEKDEKIAVVNLLNQKVQIVESKQFINNAIGIYVRSVFRALDERDVSLISDWYEL